MLQTTDELAMGKMRVLAADTLVGDKVVNHENEDLGKIEHLMIDLENGRVAYVVLSFGGFLGMGDKRLRSRGMPYKLAPWRSGSS